MIIGIHFFKYKLWLGFVWDVDPALAPLVIQRGGSSCYNPESNRRLRINGLGYWLHDNPWGMVHAQHRHGTDSRSGRVAGHDPEFPGI